jgi:chromosome segregation ATPase
MKMDQEDIEKELDRALETVQADGGGAEGRGHRQAAGGACAEAGRTGRETEEGKTDQEELKKEQEELNKEMEDLRKEMDELEKKNEELENPMDLPQDRRAGAGHPGRAAEEQRRAGEEAEPEGR